MEKQNSSIFNFSIFLLKTLIATIIFGVTFSLIFEKLIINTSQTIGASKINRLLTLEQTKEIPIFGFSRAECSFLPSIIGSEFYNYGISGTQSNIWLYLLEQELKKNKTTAIIINFDLIGLVSSDGNISNYIPHWNKSKHIIENKGEFYYNIPFIKYFGLYEQYFASYIQEKKNLTITTDNGAILQKNKQTKEMFESLVIKRRGAKVESKINNELSTKFDLLINSTERPIVLIISPYHISCFNKNANFDKSYDYLNKLEKNKNITVLDLKDFVKDDDLFMNTTHLNHEGAIIFSKKIKELLTTMNIGHLAN